MKYGNCYVRGVSVRIWDICGGWGMCGGLGVKKGKVAAIQLKFYPLSHKT